jgi:hypothetical protein
VIEQGIQEYAENTVDRIVEEGRKEFTDAFKARNEAKKRNPSFDADKPELETVLSNSVGRKYDELSPKLQEDLNNYYQFHNQNNKNPQLPAKWTVQVRKGRGDDRTIPKLRIDEQGRILPSKVNTSNRSSRSYKLPQEFVKVHGFDPSPKGLISSLRSPDRYVTDAAKGAVQFHHRVTDSVWQSNKLTQEMQRRINAGDKTVLSVDYGGNLTAMYRKPAAKERCN